MQHKLHAFYFDELHATMIAVAQTVLAATQLENSLDAI